MTIAFNCESCGAGLKVKAGAAGHTVLCPKCGKKIRVPREDGTLPEERRRRGRKTKFVSRTGDTTTSDAAKDSAPSPGSRSAPTPPPAASKEPEPKPAPSLDPRPEPKPVPEPQTAPKPEPNPEPDERGAELNRLKKQVDSLQSDLAAARKTIEEERASRQSLEAEQPDRAEIEKAVSAKYEAEVEAAKKTITELESKVSAEYRKRIELESKVAATDGKSIPVEDRPAPAPPSDETGDVIDADALISDITTSRFGKHLRTAIVIHVVVILLTSVFFLYRMFTKTEETEEPADVNVSTVEESAPAEEADVEEGRPEIAEEPEVEPSAPAPATAGKTELEESIETLPAPGEMPTDTSVSLEDDL